MKPSSKFKFYAWLVGGTGTWFTGTFVFSYFLDDHLALYSSWWNTFFGALYTLPLPLGFACAVQGGLAAFRRHRHERDYVRLVECYDQGNPDPEEVRRLFARLNKN